jgi:uncharacterized protein (TIGR03067 family)
VQAAAVQKAIDFSLGAAAVGTVPDGAAALAQEVLRIMRWIRTARVAVGLLLLVGLAAGLSLSVPGAPAGAPAPVVAPGGGTAPAGGKTVEEDRRKLQGTWEAVAAEADGKPIPAGLLQGFRMVVAGDRLTFNPETRKRESTFQVDASRQPRRLILKQLEPEARGQQVTALYAFEGASLRLCLDNAGKGTPSEFATRPGDGRRLLVLRPQQQRPPQQELSARIALKSPLALAGTRVPADLILTNQSDHPIRLGTFVNGISSMDTAGRWFKIDLGPDHFLKDSPSPETVRKHIVALGPGKSLALPFTVPVPAGAQGTMTIHAAYSTEVDFAKRFGIWSGRVRANPVSVKVRKVEWLDNRKKLSVSSLAVELIPAAQVTRTKAGRLVLPVTITNRSTQALVARLQHEWHGGIPPSTDLYAVVRPAKAKSETAFAPVYLLGERPEESGKKANLAPGASTTIDLRMDWPGTGSVIVEPLMKAPGSYRVQLLLVFEAAGARQYVASREATVTLPAK